MLVILQVAALYCYTGVVKNGSIWWRGDAFYYALNLDHFYRLPPQQLSAWFGTTLFRLNTHISHLWESFFPVVVLGLFVRFGLRERLPAWSRNERVLHAALWIAFGLGCAWLCIYLYPVHFVPPKKYIGHFNPLLRGWWTMSRVQVAMGFAWVLGMALIAWGWRRLRYDPFKVRLFKREFTIDLDTFLKWTMGRRIWVLLGFVFQLHVVVMMNIGWFQFGALSGFVPFLNGTEMALVLTLAGRAVGRLPISWLPEWMKKGQDPIPPKTPRSRTFTGTGCDCRCSRSSSRWPSR